MTLGIGEAVLITAGVLGIERQVVMRRGRQRMKRSGPSIKRSTMDQNNVELASVAHWFTHDPDEAVVFTLRALPLFEIILKSSGSLFVTFRVGFEWPSMQ